VVGVECAQGVNGVAEQLDPHRLLGRREKTSTIPPFAKPPGRAHDLHATVSGRHRVENEPVGAEGRSPLRMNAVPLGQLARRGKPRQERAGRREEDVDLAAGEAAQRDDPLTGDLRVRRDPVVGIGVEGRKPVRSASDPAGASTRGS